MLENCYLEWDILLLSLSLSTCFLMHLKPCREKKYQTTFLMGFLYELFALVLYSVILLACWLPLLNCRVVGSFFCERLPTYIQISFTYISTTTCVFKPCYNYKISLYIIYRLQNYFTFNALLLVLFCMRVSLALLFITIHSAK